MLRTAVFYAVGITHHFEGPFSLPEVSLTAIGVDAQRRIRVLKILSDK
jgi:hypothetical protein